MKKVFSMQGPISYTLMGLTLAISIFLGYTAYQRQAYLATPITEIFIADVIVPDFKTGENPQVVYDRKIEQTFLGGFTVEVKEASTGKTVCSGGSTNLLYEKDEQLPTNTSLTWYISDPCSLKLEPGQYYLDTNYVIQIEGFPNRYYTTKSNVFTVS